MHIIESAGIGGVIWYGSTLIVEGTISAGNFVSFITALVLNLVIPKEKKDKASVSE